MESKRLRKGFSTGTAAAAAVKAALIMALSGKSLARIDVTLPGNRILTVTPEFVRRKDRWWECGIIKDGGDDPDITHGALIGARVRPSPGRGIVLRAGAGVGMVTKPGLPVAVGEPAINPVPRKMIEWAVRESFEISGAEGRPGCEIEIFVPRGEELAKETLNPRLGIVGGISILGTTGIVRPFSHGAYRATIFAALKVAKACGCQELVITTGTTSDAAARGIFPDLPEEAFVQMADYVGFTMERVKTLGFSMATVVCFFGKLMKMAQGMSHTHASAGSVDLERAARWIANITGDNGLARAVANANTARGVLDLLRVRHGEAIAHIGQRAFRFLKSYLQGEVSLQLILLDFDGTVLWKREER